MDLSFLCVMLFKTFKDFGRTFLFCFEPSVFEGVNVPRYLLQLDGSSHSLKKQPRLKILRDTLLMDG